MNIYQIEQAITELIDPETGELLDYEQFEALNMARDRKIENMALWVKDLTAEAKAIREEEKALADRRRAAERKAERLKEYLSTILSGSVFRTPKVAVAYRKSSAVEVDEGFIEWAKLNAAFLLTYKEPEVSKTAVKEYLTDHALDNARVSERLAIQIK